ncbi:potassium/proton antiporter [Urinicoccus massiliensis]|uniref:potassium/proton antiporter n=1 Tax=Urinicoccus massiliensis TaxID=1723382 RepID=UPI000930E75E|nr:potassium/proton antiporter [Urinicoccus massiliensis]
MNTLIVTGILLLALVAIRISSKSGLPALLLFLGLGIAFAAGGWNFNDYGLADQIASMSLMIIMFYGGFGTNWSMGQSVAREAILLSSLGVVLTAGLTGLFCHYVLHFGLMESMLLGAVVGSTDYASVSSIMVSKKLNLKYNTASLLEIESGSNDPTAYTMTMVFLAILTGSDLSVPVLIFRQIFFGGLVGFSVGYLCLSVVRKYKFNEDGLFVVFIAALMLGVYGMSNLIGGNGFLALYIAGIILGNNEYVGKKEVVFFYDGLSHLVQIMLFFLLGLLSNPQDIFHALPLGLAIMAFMTLVARPLSVLGLMTPFRLKKNQLALISLAGIRGAAAIAFAIMAVNTGAGLDIDLFHIVFAICLFSLLIQGSLMAWATKILKMFDPNDTVLKTFNYYQDKSKLGFIQTRVTDQSMFVGMKIKDLKMVFNFIIAKIERDGKTIIPRGETVLKKGDIIVMGGESHFDQSGQSLLEIKLAPCHAWVGEKIKDLDIGENELIVMLQTAQGGLEIPRGDTVLQVDDRVVLLQGEKLKEAIDHESGQ